ncbi:uncharacterized protein F09G8.5-like [Drosophila tropicalis]|uniref:uncharacterized protein F09G8.5-like n=1 Tax=Drosophila tropicalis TaxID=46794 RepID=UPI0035AB8775
MVKLSQQLIESRGKGLDYRQILNLNIWGTDLDDISIFMEMPLLEVLSLSLNQVTTLQGLRNCLNLKELYLRKNLIEDVDELNYLKEAKNLRTFWLLENPCVEILGDNYRRAVIRRLPQLKFLDGEAITDAELRSALSEGPQKPERDEPRGPPPEAPNPIPKRAAIKNRREELKKEREQEPQMGHDADRKRPAKTRRASPPAPLEMSRPVVQERRPIADSGDGNHIEQQNEQTMPMQAMQPMPHVAQATGPQTIHCQQGTLAQQMPQVNQISQMGQMPSMQQMQMQQMPMQASSAASRSFWSESPGPDFSQNDRYMEQMNYQRSHDPMSSNFMGGCRQEEMEKMHYQAANSMMFPMNRVEHFAMRNGPVRSNVNILSSIRCLIRELDTASLVVLSQAIHEQMAKMLPTD